MAERNLRLVGAPELYELGRPPETLTERVRRLHAEAQMLACEEVEALRLTLKEAVRQAEEIQAGGEVFPVGVREQARQLTASLPLISQTLKALCDRRIQEVSGAPALPVWGQAVEEDT